MKRTTLTLIVIACAVALANTATAQTAQPNSTWRGEDNEFGSIRAPYTVDMDGGERTPVEAQVILKSLYEQKDGRFYMFSFVVTGTPLDVQLDQIIRTDTGEAMACYQIADDSEGVKCTIDRLQMPPAGTEIKMYGTVGSNSKGTFNVGAMAIAFTATWAKIQMSNGLDAELYAGTQVIVKQPTGGANVLNGMGNFVPGLGVAGLLAAAAVVAVGAAKLRGRRG